MTLADDPQGWGSLDHPEWGAFKLGKTNPNLSTSGLHATVGAFFAATGVASDLTVAQVQDPATAEYVRRLESTVVHYGDTTLTFLDNLLTADAEGQGLTYVSAVTVEEKSVLDYNAGNPAADPEATDLTPPRTPLVAVYPEEGTLLSDSPWVILQAEWVDESKAAVAADLLAWLLEEQQQQRFADVGFRTADGRTGSLATQDNGILADQPAAVLGTPTAEVLTAVRDAWRSTASPPAFCSSSTCPARWVPLSRAPDRAASSWRSRPRSARLTISPPRTPWGCGCSHPSRPREGPIRGLSWCRWDRATK